MHLWCSGSIRAFQALGPGSNPGGCTLQVLCAGNNMPGYSYLPPPIREEGNFFSQRPIQPFLKGFFSGSGRITNLPFFQKLETNSSSFLFFILNHNSDSVFLLLLVTTRKLAKPKKFDKTIQNIGKLTYVKRSIK